MNPSTMTDATLGRAVIAAARERLDACARRVRHCLDQLDDAQVWWRPRESMNGIANLLLHLVGSLRQWVVAGTRGTPDQRDRPREFAERGPFPKAELLRRFDEGVAEADAALAAVTDAQLLEGRRIQGFEETVLTAIWNNLSHFNGHTQEVVFLTRLQLGEHYRFEWVPATPEEGAPREGQA
jgi:hypothetical protein